jgi:hypothetical protein
MKTDFIITFMILLIAGVIGCSIYPGAPFYSRTIVQKELKPGCYDNIGNWVKTDYPGDWWIDYQWYPVNCEK